MSRFIPRGQEGVSSAFVSERANRSKDATRGAIGVNKMIFGRGGPKSSGNEGDLVCRKGVTCKKAGQYPHCLLELWQNVRASRKARTFVDGGSSKKTKKGEKETKKMSQKNVVSRERAQSSLEKKEEQATSPCRKLKKHTKPVKWWRGREKSHKKGPLWAKKLEMQRFANCSKGGNVTRRRMPGVHLSSGRKENA